MFEEDHRERARPRGNMLAPFDIYHSMAHYVGKLLHIKPGEILDTWSVPELLVAYGEYVNELAEQNYKQWSRLDVQTRLKTEQPPKYYVRFISLDDTD